MRLGLPRGLPLRTAGEANFRDVTEDIAELGRFRPGAGSHTLGPSCRLQK